MLRANNLHLDLGGKLLALAVDVTRPRPEEQPLPAGSIDWDVWRGREKTRRVTP